MAIAMPCNLQLPDVATIVMGLYIIATRGTKCTNSATFANANPECTYIPNVGKIRQSAVQLLSMTRHIFPARFSGANL